MEVAHSVFWVRMPLPFALDHINLWLLRDSANGVSGWTVIDCGVASIETKSRWEALFDGHLGGLPIRRILVTHCHPDRLGLAQWLATGGDRKRWDARLWVSLGEYMSGRVVANGMGSNADAHDAAQQFQLNGLSDSNLIEQVRGRTNYYAKLVPDIPARYRRIQDDDVVSIGERQWQVVTGYGHSPEHCALYRENSRLLIPGDMVLSRISTNVSVHDTEPEGNPLASYLDSLAQYESMAPDTMVLPSHGKTSRSAFGLRQQDV